MTHRRHQRADDVPLSGGRMTSGIVRRGDRLLRPMGPWSPAVHEYLRHLEAAGFEGSPRVLGIEENREVLTFIDGDVAVDPHWQPGHGHRLPPYARTDSALRGAANLLRKLHSAATGFQPAITNYRFHPHPPQTGEIISHGDLGPWNTVYRDGIPVALWADKFAAEPGGALADAYDIVCNGYEIGGGSIRIHRSAMQQQVFDVIGLSPEEARSQFGFLLDAFKYGPPPHGGIAFGWDRVVMLLAGAETIRDVIAFPKAASGADPLTGAPTPITPAQRKEAGIDVIPTPPAQS